MKTYGGSMLRSVIFWAAFLLVSSSIVFSALGATFKAADFKRNFNFGGPVPDEPSSYVVAGNGEAISSSNVGLDNIFVSQSGILGDQNPLVGIIPLGNGLIQYKVKAGDTLSSIAKQFDIPVTTIQLANRNIKSIRPNQELIILPVPGVLYQVSKGDTLSEIADKFNTTEDLLTKYNPDYQNILSGSGGSLIVPYAKISNIASLNQTSSNLPDLKNYFSLPAVGWNWGQLHNYNAVDIANQCGTPVYAAAEGLIIADPSLGDGSSGWNNGYGVFVFIEHPNGTKTRYAHLDKALVKVGDYVKKGQEIGLMGNTGNTDGPTGCHLHFEVYGAKNPFAIQ